MTTLPDKPSELIRVAIADLEKCEQDPRYVIEMSVWHEDATVVRTDADEQGKPDAICAVCLAGAVMAKSLGTKPDGRATPSMVVDGEADRGRLLALDSLRVGDMVGAMLSLGLDEPEDTSVRSVAAYHDDSIRFKSDMRRLADDLERAGL